MGKYDECKDCHWWDGDYKTTYAKCKKGEGTKKFNESAADCDKFAKR